MITNQKKQDLISALDAAGYDVATITDLPGYTQPGGVAQDQLQVTIKPKAEVASA